MKFELGDVVRLEVCFAEDRQAGKVRWGLVLQQDGELVQVIWASSQQVDSSAPRAGEFCVVEPAEMRAMGHTKPARYSFHRGGVVVVKASAIDEVVGKAPRSVLGRMVSAARNS